MKIGKKRKRKRKRQKKSPVKVTPSKVNPSGAATKGGGNFNNYKPNEAVVVKEGNDGKFLRGTIETIEDDKLIIQLQEIGKTLKKNTIITSENKNKFTIEKCADDEKKCDNMVATKEKASKKEAPTEAAVKKAPTKKVEEEATKKEGKTKATDKTNTKPTLEPTNKNQSDHDRLCELLFENADEKEEKKAIYNLIKKIMEESKGKTPGKKLLNSLYKNKMGNNPQVLDIYIRDIYNEIISKVIENVKPIEGITSNVILFENHLPKNETTEQESTKLKYSNPDDTKKIDFDFPIKIDVMKEALKEIEIKKNMILFDDEMMIMSKNKILELVYKRLSGHIESYYKSKSGSWTSWRNKKGMEVDDAKYHRYFTGIDIIRLDVNERFNGHDFNNNIRIRKLINKVFYKNDFFCEKPPYLFDNLKVEGAGLKSWLFNRKEITQKKIGKNYYGEMADTNKALLKIVRKKFDSMKGKTNINWQNLIGEKEGNIH